MGSRDRNLFWLFVAIDPPAMGNAEKYIRQKKALDLRLLTGCGPVGKPVCALIPQLPPSCFIPLRHESDFIKADPEWWAKAPVYLSSAEQQ